MLSRPSHGSRARWPDWVFFVSRRHFRTRRREKGHTAALLSVGGLAVGVITLITVIGVMNGFQLGTITNILEVGSHHVRIAPVSKELAAKSSVVAGFVEIDETALEGIRSMPGVVSVLPYRDVQSIARGFFGEPAGVLIRAVPHDALVRDRGLSEQLSISTGEFSFVDDAVVLGHELARFLGLRVGDEVSFVTISGAGARPREIQRRVAGTFRTGFLDYDRAWAFAAIDDEFVRDEPIEWGIKLENRYNDREAIDRIERLLSDRAIEARVGSWREYNRSIFAALRMEKTMMTFLLGLIFVVVGVNIHHALRRSVIERTEEIAILKALGARPSAVRLVFVFEGVWIGLVGGTLGLVLGVLLAYNINGVFLVFEAGVNMVLRLIDATIGVVGTTAEFAIFSPQFFYIEQIPSHVWFSEAFGVFAFAVLSAVLAAASASAYVARIKPAEVLRDE